MIESGAKTLCAEIAVILTKDDHTPEAPVVSCENLKRQPNALLLRA
jgi:hypothetical protein